MEIFKMKKIIISIFKIEVFGVNDNEYVIFYSKSIVGFILQVLALIALVKYILP